MTVGAAAAVDAMVTMERLKLRVEVEAGRMQDDNDGRNGRTQAQTGRRMRASSFSGGTWHKRRKANNVVSAAVAAFVCVADEKFKCALFLKMIRNKSVQKGKKVSWSPYRDKHLCTVGRRPHLPWTKHSARLRRA